MSKERFVFIHFVPMPGVEKTEELDTFRKMLSEKYMEIHDKVLERIENEDEPSAYSDLQLQEWEIHQVALMFGLVVGKEATA